MVKKVDLKRLRKQTNLSQSAIAQSIGIDQRQWNRYENGKNEIPVRYLIAICLKHGIDTNWLLEMNERRELMMTAQEAIVEFYNDIMDTINGANYEFSNREELITVIIAEIGKKKDELLKKYEIK